MATEAEKRATAKYDKENTTQVLLKLNKKTDKDILYQLNTVYSKMGYIKDLIRKDITDMMEKRKKELEEWNEREDRDDMMYYVDILEYRLNYDHYECITTDGTFAMSNNLDEIKKAFDNAVNYVKNENKDQIVRLTRFTEVYENCPEYEELASFSTLDSYYRIIY